MQPTNHIQYYFDSIACALYEVKNALLKSSPRLWLPTCVGLDGDTTPSWHWPQPPCMALMCALRFVHNVFERLTFLKKNSKFEISQRMRICTAILLI
jgi:hypothetical protein